MPLGHRAAVPADRDLVARVLRQKRQHMRLVGHPAALAMIRRDHPRELHVADVFGALAMT